MLQHYCAWRCTLFWQDLTSRYNMVHCLFMLRTHSAFVLHLLTTYYFLVILVFIAWSWAATSSPSVSPFRLLDNHLLVIVWLYVASLVSHTCPILSIRFQWTKPGVQWSLVEKLNRKYSRVHLSYRKSSNKMKPEVQTIFWDSLRGEGLESSPMESIRSIGNTTIPMESAEV